MAVIVNWDGQAQRDGTGAPRPKAPVNPAPPRTPNLARVAQTPVASKPARKTRWWIWLVVAAAPAIAAAIWLWLRF